MVPFVLSQVKKACRAYRVYYSRPTPEEVKAGDYLLDHSIISYLLDPEGDCIRPTKACSKELFAGCSLLPITEWR